MQVHFDLFLKKNQDFQLFKTMVLFNPAFFCAAQNFVNTVSSNDCDPYEKFRYTYKLLAKYIYDPLVVRSSQPVV